jgi:hypothetical protein
MEKDAVLDLDQAVAFQLLTGLKDLAQVEGLAAVLEIGRQGLESQALALAAAGLDSRESGQDFPVNGR